MGQLEKPQRMPSMEAFEGVPPPPGEPDPLGRLARLPLRLLRWLLPWLAGPLVAAALAWGIRLGAADDLPLTRPLLLAGVLGAASAARPRRMSMRIAGVLITFAATFLWQHRTQMLAAKLVLAALAPWIDSLHPAALGLGIYLLGTRLNPSNLVTKALLLGPALASLAAPASAGGPVQLSLLAWAALACAIGIFADQATRPSGGDLLHALLLQAGVGLTTCMTLIPPLRRAVLRLLWQALVWLEAWIDA